MYVKTAKQIKHLSFSDGHGAMARAWGFADVAAYRAVSEKYHFSPFLILGHCLDIVSLGKALQSQILSTLHV